MIQKVIHHFHSLSGSNLSLVYSNSDSSSIGIHDSGNLVMELTHILLKLLIHMENQQHIVIEVLQFQHRLIMVEYLFMM